MILKIIAFIGLMEIQKGKTPENAAKAWIKTHQNQVNQWFK